MLSHQHMHGNNADRLMPLGQPTAAGLYSAAVRQD